MGHGAGKTFVLSLRTHFVDILLELPDGRMGGHIVRHKQLMAPGCDSQKFLKFDADTLIDGHRTDFAALALYGDGTLPEGLCHDGGFGRCPGFFDFTVMKYSFIFQICSDGYSTPADTG